MIAIIVAATAGVISGWIFGEDMLAFSFAGDIFLELLKALAIPLIVFSMISGIASLKDIRKLGSLGASTVSYYLVTTGIAVFIGLVFVNIIKPGMGFEAIALDTIPEKVQQKTEYSLIDVIAGIFSANLFMILIIFSLICGIVLSIINKKAQKVIMAINYFHELTMKILHWFLWIAPLGIFAVVAARLGKAGGGEAFYAELIKVGKYSLTVILALIFHAVIIMPMILRFLAKINPVEYFKQILPALSTAFATASSSATLPVTIESVSENKDISEQVSSFVLPLGATINMDGTALYEAVAAIFIAQVYGIDLSFSQQIMIFLTANLAAIGAAGIPEAGLVTMVIVLRSVNLPLEGIGLLLSVDWFLDRWRTSVNVWGDAVGAAVLSKFNMGSKNKT